jgi:hypothetical protein
MSAQPKWTFALASLLIKKNNGIARVQYDQRFGNVVKKYFQIQINHCINKKSPSLTPPNGARMGVE